MQLDSDDSIAFEGGRWMNMRDVESGGSWFGSIDVFHPAPRLRVAAEMARDWLDAPHNSSRRDVLMLECSDAAQRLVAVARDPDEEAPVPFIADFLATLVIAIARAGDES